MNNSILTICDKYVFQIPQYLNIIKQNILIKQISKGISAFILETVATGSSEKPYIKSRRQNFRLQIFKIKFSPSYIILRLQGLEGKK